jgi:hypothetical protein
VRTGAGLEEAEDVREVGVGHPEHEQLKLPESGQAGPLDECRYGGRHILQCRQKKKYND